MIITFIVALLLAEGPKTGEPEAAAAAAQVDPKVDAILTALQKRSDGLKDIECAVVQMEKDRINLAERKRIGRIRFLITEPNPIFLIQIDKSFVDGLKGKREWYLFDGRWLHEGMERTEQVTSREILAPGEKIDLFDLEKTPFPVPFGHRKEQVIEHFDCKLVEASAEDPPETDHLVCTPKPESSMAREWDKLEFFVRRDLSLPQRLVVTKRGGLEEITMDYPDLSEKSINTGLSRKDFEEPKEWRKYKRLLEPFQASEPGKDR